MGGGWYVCVIPFMNSPKSEKIINYNTDIINLT